ncbi:transglycosylase SLT domain-containing protein [Rhizobium sp. AG207R]|uniref:transglycosylase SLT domain-containing protein n=1 Tax=Rhizobium sp. AG207R TaxID=2802287 RepID=UPI0022AC89E1|nr:transglycosylase SLT domain-containing protein [Rhizobium sp. AG207R]MCZ3377420.1 transglycosylase SLT domain-containing protein [Rhizobium sp. AG207R]
MAILPTKFSLSQPSTFVSGRHVATQDTTDIGKGLASLGQSVASIGNDIQQQQDTVDISRAEAAKAQGLIDTQNKFTDDPDYSTFNQRAPKDTADVVNNAANLIRNPQMREKWKIQAGTDAARVNDAIGDKARALGKQAETVAFDNSLETQRRIYVDPTTSDEQKAAARAAMEGSIETGLKTGLLTPDAADARRKQYVEGADTNRLKLLAETNPSEVASWGLNGNPVHGAIMQVESNGNPNAVSAKGAAGLMQVTPATGTEIAQELGDKNFPVNGTDAQKIEYLKNPDVSKKYGTYYYDKQLQKYGGDQEAALIAYNGGPARADAWLAAGRDDSVIPKETADYYKKVLAGTGAGAPSVPGRTMAETGPSAARDFLTSISSHGARSIDSMQEGFGNKLSNLIQSAPPEIRSGLGIYSGARTPEEQAQIISSNAAKYGLDKAAWDSDVASMGPVAAGQKWASQFKASGMSAFIAKPGGSNHQNGTAADLSYNGKSLKDAPQNVVDWLHQNAGAYGLKFPLANENWHIEDASTRGGTAGAPVSSAPDWVKRISPEDQQVAYQLATTKLKQQQVEARGNIETVVQNAPVAIQNTGSYSGSTPTQQQFVDAYGPQEGQQKYDAFTASLDVAQSAYNFRTMSANDIQKLVQASVPTSSGNDAALEEKKYTALSQAASQTLAARKADPATYTMQAFPNVQQAWNDAATSGNYQPAMAATAAAQQQLGMQQMELLPKSIADRAVESFKSPDATDQQRISAVTGLIFSTPDQGQRQAVFKQLVDAGLPAMTEGVVEAAARGDQGAANRLLQAALVDPAKLPKSGEVKPTDIDNELYSSVWAPGQIGDASYGVGYGDASSLERAQRGSDLMKKAVQLRISQGQDLQSAVAGASKDLFGDQKVYNGSGSVSANLPVPSNTDTSLLTAGLEAAKTSFKAALDQQKDRILSGTKPPPGPTGNFEGMISKGNIDLAARPVVKNDDGTISTVRSMSFNEDGKEILVPTVSPDGKILSDQEAIDLYHQTGQNLGVFKNSDAADAYATALHDAQAKYYANPSADGTRAILDATVQNRMDDVLQNGVFVPAGNGIGLRDPYTGAFVMGSNGQPLSLPIDKVLDMGRANPIGGNEPGTRYSAGQANTGMVQPREVQQYLKGGTVDSNQISPEASRWMSGQPVDAQPDVKKNSTPDQGSADLSNLSPVERGFLGALSAAESAGIGGTKLKLYNDIIQRGRTATITENDLQPDEQEKLKALVLKQGKPEGKIDYKDYVGSGMPEDILGGFRYKVDNGVVHITDTYDFNKAKGGSWDDNSLVQALAAFTSPKNLAAEIGRKIAPDSKPGVPVRITLK